MDPRYATVAAPDVLRAALEGLPIGVMLVSSDGAIVHTNRRLERLFGYATGELIGGSLEMLFPDGIDTSPGDDRGDHLRPREVLGRRIDGSELPLEITQAPISVGDSTFVLLPIVDTRERRRLQNELQTLRDERLQFETLIGELGAEFVSLRAGEADRMIDEALGRLVRALDLDRSLLCLLADDGDVVNTHQWTRPGLASAPGRVSARELVPWHLAKVRASELASFSTLDELPDETDRESMRRFGTKSGITVPLVVDGKVWGAVSFAAVREARTWSQDIVNRLRVVALLFANALARKKVDEELRLAAAEGAMLRQRLRYENAYLRRELKGFTGESAIIGHSPGIRRVIEQVRQVAPTDSTVLLTGETGTGKARIAAWIHELSSRSDHGLVRVNCASLNAASIEGELFGVERGSYGEKESRRIGRLEIADRSTVVLDEIGDLPVDAQASLIRVLQDKQIHPLGSAKQVPVDIRVLATSRRDLKQCVEEGTFRDDLYYRLSVFPIHVPPLRERPEDIPLLVWRFVDEFSESLGKPIDAIDKASMTALQRYRWPGNARELRNVVERAMIVGAGRHLRITVPGLGDLLARGETLAAVERAHIAAVLSACRGRIQGKQGAAVRLGLAPRALISKMGKLGMRVPRTQVRPVKS